MDLTKVKNAITLLNEFVAENEGQPEPPPEPEPGPELLATYKVTEEKAIANYSPKDNDAGYPMMVLIPVDERNGQPFKNLQGQTVRVYREKTNADGSWDFHRIYGVTRKGTGQALYLSKADGKLID